MGSQVNPFYLTGLASEEPHLPSERGGGIVRFPTLEWDPAATTFRETERHTSQWCWWAPLPSSHPSPDRDLKSSVQAASRFLPQRAPLWDLPPLLPLTHCSPTVSTQRLSCPFVFLHPGGDRLSLLLMHEVFPGFYCTLDTIHTLRGEGLRTLENHFRPTIFLSTSHKSSLA